MRWGKRSRRLRQVVCWLLAGACAAGSVGCTRHFFRKRVDQEVAEVLAEKDQYPNWRIDQFHVYPDPRARFADSTDYDHPPMPPDDPAAWNMSPHPQKPGLAGVTKVQGSGYLDLLKTWDAENRTEALAQQEPPVAPTGDNLKPAVPEKLPKPPTPVEVKNLPESSPPNEPAQRPLSCGLTIDQPKQPYLIKAEQAVELGLINSREYQDRREDLYATALPVTLERFSFAAQFFATGSVLRERSARESQSGEHNRWTANFTNNGFSKLFSTGALLLFRYANQTVVELTGNPRHTTSLSTVNLDLFQPLLRGGGRAVTLEPLTQAERSLLYEIRDYAQFRKAYYAYIVGGVDFTRATLATPSVLARTILPAAATTAVSGAAGRAQVSPGSGQRLGSVLPPTAASAGYLPTLVLAATVASDRLNIVALERFLKLFQAIKEGGDVSQLQVDQVEFQLLQGRSRLQLDELMYRNMLDGLKLQLGVPTNLPLELDDTPIRPMTEQFVRFQRVFDQYRAAVETANKHDSIEETAQLRGRLRQIFTTSPAVYGTRFRTEYPKQWQAWEKLSDKEIEKRLADYGEERRKLLARKADLEAKDQTLSPQDQRRLAELDFQIDLGSFERALRRYESQPWKAQPDPERQKRLHATLFRDVAYLLALVLAEARTQRVEQVHETWAKLPRVCVDGRDLIDTDLTTAETAVAQAALTNRLDLMNQRAQLVDSWRQIAVAANGLLGTFNVTYHTDSTTPPGEAKPFAFAGVRSRHQLIMDWDLPLVRVSEQINYRTALIAYQRQRRGLMSQEDLVLNTVRTDIRQLRVQAEIYKIQTRAVELAFFQVENAEDTFRSPPTVGPTAGGNTAANAAALTTQLLNAQSSLLQAQISLLNAWNNFLIARMTLYRDLELMPLDFRGVWTDDIATSQCSPGGSGRTAECGGAVDADQRSVPEPENGGVPERLPESLAPAAGPALWDRR
jgi:hypothetical protein